MSRNTAVDLACEGFVDAIDGEDVVGVNTPTRTLLHITRQERSPVQ